jgi:alkylation response protein AidB-like acyl-CoA dehydrogenase
MAPTHPSAGEYDDLVAHLQSLLSIADHGSGGAAGDADADTLAAGRAYLAGLAPGGWMVPTWPKSYGGRTATPDEARDIRDVLRSFTSPDLYLFFVGLNMIGPTLLTHGTSEQCERWMPAIASGQEIWCQMFSEPEAGSDLANVATAARQAGEGWRINGQKVWTSRAHCANWGLCLARTDPELPKHQGLSMFAVPIEDPGITVRPLVQMNGDRHFSEVFLDNVRVSQAELIGAAGDGWKIAQTVLAHERSSIAGAGGRSRKGGPQTTVPRWLRSMAESADPRDQGHLDAAIAAYVEAEVTRLTAARTAAYARAGRGPGPESSGQKLRVVASLKRRAWLAQELLGADGLLSGHAVHDEVLVAPSLSIRGGTDEIQRNIVAERVLKLPAEPRTDRDVLWSVSRRGGLP